jgi:hypothetical protein
MPIYIYIDYRGTTLVCDKRFAFVVKTKVGRGD